MARTYRRDSLGRFAGGGGSTRQRAAALRARTTPEQTRSSRQPAFRGQLLKASVTKGTARPAGTIAGTALGRQRSQFGQEMAAMGMRGKGPQRLRRQAGSTARARTADGWQRSSAPRGTISASRGGRGASAELRAIYNGERQRNVVSSGKRSVRAATRASRRR